jgi:hypothetical protein
MIVAMNRNTLETPLSGASITRGAVRSAPPYCVRVRQRLEEIRWLTVFSRPENNVPAPGKKGYGSVTAIHLQLRTCASGA